MSQLKDPWLTLYATIRQTSMALCTKGTFFYRILDNNADHLSGGGGQCMLHTNKPCNSSFRLFDRYIHLCKRVVSLQIVFGQTRTRPALYSDAYQCLLGSVGHNTAVLCALQQRNVDQVTASQLAAHEGVITEHAFQVTALHLDKRHIRFMID